MDAQVSLDAVCTPSEDVVVREIEGNVIIIPVAAGIVEVEGELFTLNPTGHAIWRKLDGQRTLREVASALSRDYDAPSSDIEVDVVAFADALRQRRLVVLHEHRASVGSRCTTFAR